MSNAEGAKTRGVLTALPSPSAEPVAGNVPDRSAALLVCVLVLVVSIASLAIALNLRRTPEAEMINVFYWFQREHEPVPLAVSIVFVLALIVALLRGRTAREHECATTQLQGGRDVATRQMWLLAITVTVVTWAITHWVMHDYALSGDEWSASFQAKILARGMLAAPVPEEWRPYVRAMLPPYIRYDAAHGTWESMYLPVHAAIRSMFVRAGVESLANPVLAGLTVLGLAGVARRLWPGQGRMQWLALAMLVTSAQFLLMSGTAYAMSAHLCLNTWWLWCWLRRDDSHLYIAALPALGVAALGLHQVFPHALFAAPFLLRMLFERRWIRTLAVSATYGFGCVVWLGWMRRVGAETRYSLQSLVGVPDVVLTTENAALVVSWQAPLVAVAAVCALLQRREGPTAVRDLAYGLVLTTGLYACFQLDQQHGWGYRYVYAVLGNLVLMSAWGARCLGRHVRAGDARALGFGSLLASLVLLLPLRAWHAERFVRPFADSAALIARIDADVVVIPGKAVWYGHDFVRSAPYPGETPYVINADYPGVAAKLPRLQSRVRVMTAGDFYRVGLPYRDMSVARPQLKQTITPVTPDVPDRRN